MVLVTRHASYGDEFDYNFNLDIQIKITSALHTFWLFGGGG